MLERFRDRKQLDSASVMPLKKADSFSARFQMEFDFSNINGLDWFNGNAAISHWFDAYTLLVPENEAFYIRTLRNLVSSASPDEKRLLRIFFGQEARHGEAHRLYAHKMNEMGLATAPFVELANGIFYGALEPIQPIGLRMATVAAIEHVNASMAHIVLSKDMFRNAHSDVRRLFYWHFAEEIEHKCVAHDFLVRDRPSYFLRALGGLIGFSAFFLASFTGMCFLLAQRKRLFTWKTLSELKAFWIDEGVLKESVRHLASYFALNFDPRNLSDSALVDQVRGMLLEEC